MLLLFSHRFFDRFLVALGSHFGSILGPFWGSKSVIFGIDFFMIFACRSKSAPRASKSGFWVVLGLSWGGLGVVLGGLGPAWGTFWAIFGAKNCTKGEEKSERERRKAKNIKKIDAKLISIQNM